MVNREKWADFVQLAITTKLHKQHGVGERQYTSFTCPYNCGKAVEVATALVSDKKSSECVDHLLTCLGVTDDGRRAQEDPRLLKSTKYRKRSLEGAASRVSTESTELATRCDALAQEKTDLLAVNANLQQQVDTLTSKVESLELAKTDTNAEFARLRQQMSDMQRQLREGEQARNRLEGNVGTIAQRLGYTLPPPPIDTLLTDITNLQKKRAPQSKHTQSYAPLNAQTAERMQRSDDDKQELKQVRAALSAEKRETARLRACNAPTQKGIEAKAWRQVRNLVMKDYHPDKVCAYPSAKTMATELAKTVNQMVEAHTP